MIHCFHNLSFQCLRYEFVPSFVFTRDSCHATSGQIRRIFAAVAECASATFSAFSLLIFQACVTINRNTLSTLVRIECAKFISALPLGSEVAEAQRRTDGTRRWRIAGKPSDTTRPRHPVDSVSQLDHSRSHLRKMSLLRNYCHVPRVVRRHPPSRR